MKGTLTQGGTATDATPQGIDQALAGGQFFWLDLDIHDPGPDDDVTGMLINTFHFHPVAVEAADKFGQRARIDDYADFVHIVTFGMAGDGKNVAEVHCFITETSTTTSSASATWWTATATSSVEPWIPTFPWCPTG